MTKRFRIAHARIDMAGLGSRQAGGDRAFFESALSEAWVPGAEVTRHRRTWKLSGRHLYKSHVWTGHMGFVREGGLTTLDWDDSRQDFVRGEASSGVVVPFLIDANDGVVSFQLIPNEVRVNTVTTNLRALLNVHASLPFVVEPLALPTTFKAWREDVAHISRFNVRLDRPNPRYSNKRVEDLIEGLDARRVRLRALAADGGIDPDGSWFQQTMDHVRNGHGHARVSGITKQTGEETTYTESEAGGSVSLIDSLEADEDAVEASPDQLFSSKTQLPDSLIVEAPDEDEAEDPEEA